MCACVCVREKKKEESEVFRERKKGEKGRKRASFFLGKKPARLLLENNHVGYRFSVVGEILILDVNKKKTVRNYKITGSNLSKNNSFKNYLTLS